MSKSVKNNSSPKTPNKDKAIYPEDKDWANFTVNLHDGWADDVSLVYPDESWKPDDDELTKVSIDDDNEYDENSEDSIETQAPKSSKLLSKFSLFLIIWFFLLSVVATILLISYYDYLERYQIAYEESRPETLINSCIGWFEERDVDSIYSAITTLPVTNAFENDLSIKSYIANNSVSENILYKKTEHYSEELPEYYLIAKDNIFATIALRSSNEQTDDFGFPVRFISYFEYTFETKYNIKIKAPKNVKLYVNDILVNNDFKFENNGSEDIFIINGFYSKPSIIAKDNNDNNLVVYYDEENDIYSVE